VWLNYLLFCTAASLNQVAWNQRNKSHVVDMPLWCSSPTAQLLFSVIALISWIAEISLGILLIGWLAGLLTWIPVLVVVSIVALIFGKNPALPLLIGIVLMVVSVFLLL